MTIAEEAAWAEAFPKEHGDPLGIRTLPSPWVAFVAGYAAGRKCENVRPEGSSDG